MMTTKNKYPLLHQFAQDSEGQVWVDFFTLEQVADLPADELAFLLSTYWTSFGRWLLYRAVGQVVK